MIYLDNNATTRVADEVLEAMKPYYTTWYGNPHSAHALGRAAHEGIEKGRAEVAELLGGKAHEVVFTSCGTESNAIVIRHIARKGRARFVATAGEHPSILNLLRELEGEGHELTVVGIDGDGKIDLGAMETALAGGADLVCAMLAQNETGVIHDIPAVARLAQKSGARLLVDAVQASGKIEIDVSALGADYVSISGHKFHAPKGVGALWAREIAELTPLWRGGGQEQGLRSGTESVPLIVGLGKAASLAKRRLPSMDCVGELRDRLEAGIAAVSDVRVHGAASPRLPNTASIGFRGGDATALVGRLDEAGVCVSAGAACHSGARSASAVLRAMNVPDDYAFGTVRFSLSRETTPAEIEETIGILART